MSEKTASARITNLVEEGMTYAQAYKVVFPTSIEKTANAGKVKALLQQGMGLKEALRKAYPDWSDEQVAAAAAKLGGGEKTAAAQPSVPSAVKFPKVPTKSTFQASGGRQVASNTVRNQGQQKNIKVNPVPDIRQNASLEAKLGSVLRSPNKYELKTLPSPKKNPSRIAPEPETVTGINHDRGFVGLAGLPKADSPPYNMEPHQKYASMTLSGLRHASSSLYDAYLDNGFEKAAFLSGLKSMFNVGSGVGKWAGGGAVAGALGGALSKGRNLHKFVTAGGSAAAKARNKTIIEAGIINAKKAQNPKMILSSAEAETVRKANLLKRYAANPKLKGGASFSQAPLEHLSALGPDVGRWAAQTGALGAIAGAGSKMVHGAIKRRKMINTAKQLAIPAAALAGGALLLKD
jgi:hypothetical protein